MLKQRPAGSWHDGFYSDLPSLRRLPQCRLCIPRMMDDAHDNHHMLFYSIEKPMFPMRQAADTSAQIGTGHSNLWMRRQQVERFVEPQKIGVGCVCVELFGAVQANFNQIGPRCRA